MKKKKFKKMKESDMGELYFFSVPVHSVRGINHDIAIDGRQVRVKKTAKGYLLI